MEIGYQGIKGAFGETAAKDYFKGSNCLFKSYNTFRKVLEAVKNEEVYYGVLPVENTFTGEVIEVYDLLMEYNLHIVGEEIVKVEHALLGVKGAQIQEIRQVYSHPQALSQCSHFLDTLNIDTVSYTNTAAASQYVGKLGEKSKAAIGSQRAGKLYGLEVIESTIANSDQNFTRFIIVGKTIQKDKKYDKVSIVFTTDHVSGALYSALSHFAYHNLNLLKIHSRPNRYQSWHYYFFVDLEGNLLDQNTQEALKEVESHCKYFKVLGNYNQCKRDGGINYE